MIPSRLALVLALLAAPSVAAEEACSVERYEAASVELERRTCEDARSIEASETDPNGRTAVAWYDDERGRGLQVQRPPRLLLWEEVAGECRILYSVAGEEELDCVAGAPPAPP